MAGQDHFDPVGLEVKYLLHAGLSLARCCNGIPAGEWYYLAESIRLLWARRRGINRLVQGLAKGALRAGACILDRHHLGCAGGLLQTDFGRIVVPDLSATVVADQEGGRCDLAQGET